MIFWIVLVYAAIAAAELPYLIKNKRAKEIAIFSVLFVAGFVVAVLVALQIKTPGIVKPIDDLVKLLGLGYK